MKRKIEKDYCSISTFKCILLVSMRKLIVSPPAINACYYILLRQTALNKFFLGCTAGNSKRISSICYRVQTEQTNHDIKFLNSL
jgi:hypothetical protein